MGAIQGFLTLKSIFKLLYSFNNPMKDPRHPFCLHCSKISKGKVYLEEEEEDWTQLDSRLTGTSPAYNIFETATKSRLIKCLLG